MSRLVRDRRSAPNGLRAVVRVGAVLALLAIDAVAAAAPSAGIARGLDLLACCCGALWVAPVEQALRGARRVAAGRPRDDRRDWGLQEAANHHARRPDSWRLIGAVERVIE